MNINITHLTSAHPRYDTRIFLKECKSLATLGYRTNLIVADGFNAETKNGVNIYNTSSKATNRFIRVIKNAFLVYIKAKDLKADIYHFHDPELILYGLLLTLRGNKVVYDIHEDLSQQILLKPWIPKIIRKFVSLLFKKIESYACQKFYSLVVPQDEMQYYFSKYNKHTYTLYNFPNAMTKSVNFESKNPFQLIYAGSIGEERGVFNMLNLILELHNLDTRYKLVLAGNISPSLLNELNRHPGWSYVDYRGNLDKNELYKLYAESTIGLILFNNVGQYYMSYALKLFEYMQNGLTVIMPNFGNWLDFNRDFNVGYCVDVNKPTETAKLIYRLSHLDQEQFCIKNQKLCSERFTWESQIEKFDLIYNH